MKYNHNLYMLKLTLKNMWPLCWKETARKDKEAWYKGERASHKQELDKINEKVDKILPILIKAQMERHHGSNELYAQFRVDSQLVHNLVSSPVVDQEIWKYIAERMAYEFEVQLKTMKFSQIKVVYPERKREPYL